jgi:hypothetical protein
MTAPYGQPHSNRNSRAKVAKWTLDLARDPRAMVAWKYLEGNGLAGIENDSLSLDHLATGPITILQPRRAVWSHMAEVPRSLHSLH